MAAFDRIVEFGIDKKDLDAADEVLQSLGVSRTNFLRSALAYVAERRRVPFEIKRRRRTRTAPVKGA